MCFLHSWHCTCDGFILKSSPSYLLCLFPPGYTSSGFPPPTLAVLTLLQVPFPGLYLNVIPLDLMGELSSLYMCSLGDLTFSVSSLICTWYLSLQDLLLCSPVTATSFHLLLLHLASLPWFVTQPYAQVNKPEIQALPPHVFGALPPHVLPASCLPRSPLIFSLSSGPSPCHFHNLEPSNSPVAPPTFPTPANLQFYTGPWGLFTKTQT